MLCLSQHVFRMHENMKDRTRSLTNSKIQQSLRYKHKQNLLRAAVMSDDLSWGTCTVHVALTDYQNTECGYV